MTLRSQGIRPTRIGKGSGVKIGFGFKAALPRVSLELLVTFTRQLQVLVGAGIPLVQSLEILSEQAGSEAFKTVIIAIKEKVSSGSYLWEALALYPNVFPKLYIALIRAGEASGAMDQMLQRLAKYLEDADKLQKLVKSSMMYPAIVSIIGVGVVALMLIFVIPKFEAMLVSAGQELPAPTQIVLSMSHFLTNYIVYIVVGIGMSIYVVGRYVRSEEGKPVMDAILFRTPLFGSIIKKSGIARFARTMQTLLSSGVNLIDAIEICKTTIDNSVLESAVKRIRGEVENGKTLGTVVGEVGVFPRMAVQMIGVGESTGNLDKMLGKIADFYESEVETLISGMTKLIEPIVLVVLGGTVGGMLVAMYLPIFKIAAAS